MNTPGARTESLTPLQRAARQVLDLRARLKAAETACREPIAVVGIDVRFPGGVRSVEDFWDLLESGRDGIGPVPADRWDADAYFDPNRRTPGKAYCREGGFIDGVDRFDAAFFGISAREADSIDPQHRLLLETSWRALEHAGVAPDSLVDTPTGVFVGLCSNDYEMLTLFRGAADVFFLPGTRPHAAAGRISHTLGLRGPSMVFDTACSSSLVAVHAACQSLRNDECTLALAAGVNLILMPDGMVILCQAEMLSADGRCKTCDAGGDGYGRGEGVGVVVLKRLSKAEADGDTILAVILGSAVNHDGASSGMTVPNAAAQQQVIAKAMENAGVTASDVGYVEMHGTGTPLGDPIEVRSLAAVHTGAHAPDSRLIIGAVKSNIGHLEGAAGIASLAKVVGCVHRGRIMGNLHFDTPNPAIDWDAAPLRLATETHDWMVGAEDRRIAGLSAFGASGTNVHMIVASAPAGDKGPDAAQFEPESRLFVLSADDEGSLRRQALRFAETLDDLSPEDWPDAAAQAAIGRAHRPLRLAFTADSAPDAARRLRDYLDGRSDEATRSGLAARRVSLIGIHPPDPRHGKVEDLIKTLNEWGLDVEPTNDGGDGFDHVIDLSQAGSYGSDRLLNAVARVFVAGGRIDWRALHAPWPRRRIRLPLTEFRGCRHWLSEGDTPVTVPLRPPAVPLSPVQAGSPLASVFERQIEETASALNAIVRQQLDHLRITGAVSSAPPPSVRIRDPEDWHILAVSASDPAGVDVRLSQLAQSLKTDPVSAWDRHANHPQGDGRMSAILLARDPAEAARILTAGNTGGPRRLWRGRRPDTPVRPVFMLSGIGDHYPGLGRGLMERWPAFRAAVEDCLGRVEPNLAAAIRAMMAFAPKPPSEGSGPNLKAMLGRTPRVETEAAPIHRIHLLVFIVEYALVRLLASFGVEPAVLAGYSLGDYVAAAISGVMSLDDSLAIVVARGQLMDGVDEGGMLAVPMAAGDIVALLPDGVETAVTATPATTIVAGANSGLSALETALRERDILSRRLGVRRPFHTKAIADIKAPFLEALRGIRLNPPEFPFVSGTTGDWIAVEEAVDPRFWVRHSLEAVRWREVLSTLVAADHALLIEIGPGNSLTSFAMQHEAASKITAVPTMRGADDGQNDDAVLLGAVARLWLSGIELDWREIAGECRG